MDFTEIYQLLQVADLSNKWPELRNIHNAALAKLREHNAGHKAPEVRRPESMQTGPAIVRRPVGGPNAA